MTAERERRIRAAAQGEWKLDMALALRVLLEELDREREVSRRLATAGVRLLHHNSMCNIVIHKDAALACTCGAGPMREALFVFDSSTGKG